MATVTGLQAQIDYLLRRQFGTLAPPTFGSGQREGQYAQAREHHQLMLATRAEYEGMTLAQVNTLAQEAKEADARAAKLKAEHDERALFFHQAHAAADFPYWGKMTSWTLDEGVALSMGKDPRLVNWRSVTGNDDRFVATALANSPFAKEYGQRRELVKRAAASGDLSDPIKPEIFLAWASDTFDLVPPELVEQALARGKRVANQRSLIAERDSLKVRITELESQLLDQAGKQLQDFDPNTSDYPKELHIAYLAWSAVSSDTKAILPPKARLQAWLKATYPELSNEALSRIATVCNWNRAGGRGKQTGA